MSGLPEVEGGNMKKTQNEHCVLIEINEDKPHEDYIERFYFQEKEMCGMYRSMGFGCSLDIYQKGKIKDILDSKEKELIADITPEPNCVVFRYYGGRMI